MTKTKPSILMVDDEPANLQLLSVALATDYKLFIAHSGAMALQVVSRSPPDLILLDVMMPEMNGFQVCERIKAQPALRHIPVIFLTALSDSESENIGLSLGAVDYISKPIKVGIARRRIANLLECERLRHALEVQRDQLEEKVAERTMALSIAMEEAQASHRTRTRFLNSLTHELRTPITLIMGITEITLINTSDPDQVDNLAKVQRAAEQLSLLINNLVDVTTQEA